MYFPIISTSSVFHLELNYLYYHGCFEIYLSELFIEFKQYWKKEAICFRKIIFNKEFHTMYTCIIC